MIVVMDSCSNWAEVYVLPNQKPATLVEVWTKEWICSFEVSLDLDSDFLSHARPLSLRKFCCDGEGYINMPCNRNDFRY